jgi:hypothetical protein
MPQADLLSFSPTLLVVPLVFLVGYTVFVTRWAPRIVLTLKARAWLTRYHAAALVGLTAPAGWPELTLMTIQFALLVWAVTRVTLVTYDLPRLVRTVPAVPPAVTPAHVGATPVENFFAGWHRGRTSFLVSPAAAGLTRAVDRVANSFDTPVATRHFPALLVKLRYALATHLSGLPAQDHRV